MPTGSAVSVLSCDGWCQVVYNGKKGWVYKNFLAPAKTQKQSAATPRKQVAAKQQSRTAAKPSAASPNCGKASGCGKAADARRGRDGGHRLPGAGSRRHASEADGGCSEATARAMKVLPAQIGLLNVSQDDSLPDCSPAANHCWRCAEVPWLKLSGTT